MYNHPFPVRKDGLYWKDILTQVVLDTMACAVCGLTFLQKKDADTVSGSLSLFYIASRRQTEVRLAIAFYKSFCAYRSPPSVSSPTLIKKQPYIHSPIAVV